MKKLAHAIIKNLVIIFSPSTWIRNYRNPREHGQEFTQLMGEDKLNPSCLSGDKLGCISMWEERHPNDYFHPSGYRVLPSLKPVGKAYEQLKSDKI